MLCMQKIRSIFAAAFGIDGGDFLCQGRYLGRFWRSFSGQKKGNKVSLN